MFSPKGKQAERLRQERQRLAEDLERERVERVEVQRGAERLEQELARLEQELRRSQAEPTYRKSAAASDRTTESGASRPWWLRPLLVVGLQDGAMQGAWTSVFRGAGVRLCRILDMNFGEFLFQAVG